MWLDRNKGACQEEPYTTVCRLEWIPEFLTLWPFQNLETLILVPEKQQKMNASESCICVTPNVRTLQALGINSESYVLPQTES